MRSDFNPLTGDTHEALRRSVRDFAEKRIRPNAKRYDSERKHPTELVREAAALGFVGPMIPDTYGGSGADLLSAAIIAEELTAVGASVGICVSSAALGMEMVEAFGTAEQKQRLLPPAAKGEWISGIAITEPDAGSDVASLTTMAERTPDGYRLNGRKVFISNGGIATNVIVLAKTDQGITHDNMSCFIVPTSSAGYQATRMTTMGWRANDTAELVFENLSVPREDLLGTEGRGFQHVMQFFDRARVLAAANALGFAQGAMELALTYVQARQQFGRPISDFQGVRFHIADMETKVAAARMLVYSAAVAYDRGQKTTKAAAMAKLVASEAAEDVTSIAFQLHGGYAFTPDFEIERFYRDVRIMTIVEGTSEIQRVIIARESLERGA